MKVICAPDPAALQTGDLSFAMMQAPSDPAHGTVGRSFREAVRRQGVAPTTAAWDFVLLALAAVAADHGCLRNQSPDGWTRKIDLHVALVDPARWAPHVDSLVEALRFLTGDIWSISVYGGGLPPLRRNNRVRRPLIEGDCVSLLSGGVDSLVGGIDLTSTGHTPVFVSQVAKGDSDRQSEFAKAVGPACSHVQLSHAAQVPGTAERSQRARSIIFLALGAIVAATIEDAGGGGCKLIVPENGFISYNVPLTPLRVGSLSTRTTHPYFLRLIQQTWDSAGLKTRIENPYQHMTKGEMLSCCSDQDLLASLVSSSTSCSRFGRFGYRHCGRCVPCLVRRAAFIAWGQPDVTDYVYEDLKAQSDSDDVRSVALACICSESEGVHRWSRNALSSRHVDDVDAAVELVERGLQELQALFRSKGVL
jgi:hypothetical protein